MTNRLNDNILSIKCKRIPGIRMLVPDGILQLCVSLWAWMFGNLPYHVHALRVALIVVALCVGIVVVDLSFDQAIDRFALRHEAFGNHKFL